MHQHGLGHAAVTNKPSSLPLTQSHCIVGQQGNFDCRGNLRSQLDGGTIWIQLSMTAKVKLTQTQPRSDTVILFLPEIRGREATLAKASHDIYTMILCPYVTISGNSLQFSLLHFATVIIIYICEYFIKFFSPTTS